MAAARYAGGQCLRGCEGCSDLGRRRRSSLPAGRARGVDVEERVDADAGPLGASDAAEPAEPAEPAPVRRLDVAPWQTQAAVRAVEPLVVRRHARKALDELREAHPSRAAGAYLSRLDRLIDADQLDLPPFPDVAQELDGLLKETNTDILQIARVVERDPGLVRRVWRQARSALYASPPRSLHHAVARVGLDALWRIGMSVCLNDTVLRVDGFQDEAGELRSLGIATAEVAAQLGGEKRGNLYMSGLLHDVGRLLVLRAAGEVGEKPDMALIRAAQDRVGAALAVSSSRPGASTRRSRSAWASRRASTPLHTLRASARYPGGVHRGPRRGPAATGIRAGRLRPGGRDQRPRLRWPERGDWRRGAGPVGGPGRPVRARLRPRAEPRRAPLAVSVGGRSRGPGRTSAPRSRGG